MIYDADDNDDSGDGDENNDRDDGDSLINYTSNHFATLEEHSLPSEDRLFYT